MERIYYFYRAFSDKFWDEHIWLPPNTTWADISTDYKSDIRYTDYRHLLFPIPMAFVVLLIRYILERYWFSPMGRMVGIKNTRNKKAQPNSTLEKSYLENKHPNHQQILGLSKQLDISERQIERWLRLRRSQDKPSTLVKFCENAWRCLYYTFSFVFGLYVLWDKPWLWDINHAWYGYPHQGYTTDIWYYYMIELSFYWSLCISQFWDVKRKDFWQMFVHHIATITLMGLSWLCNLHRIGTLVLVVHDCADILLELAKMLKYMGWQSLCDIVFGFFTILWIVTRIGVFPLWIIRSTSIEAPKILPMFPAYYIFNTLLLLLLVLHVIWTWLILRIAYRALRAGQMEGDIRSSSSSFDTTEEEEIARGDGVELKSNKRKSKTTKSSLKIEGNVDDRESDEEKQSIYNTAKPNEIKKSEEQAEGVNVVNGSLKSY